MGSHRIQSARTHSRPGEHRERNQSGSLVVSPSNAHKEGMLGAERAVIAKEYQLQQEEAQSGRFPLCSFCNQAASVDFSGKGPKRQQAAAPRPSAVSVAAIMLYKV